MPAQPVDHSIDDLPLGPQGDPDQIEVLGPRGGDGRTIRVAHELRPASGDPTEDEGVTFALYQPARSSRFAPREAGNR
jgi:hypothetical protein